MLREVSAGYDAVRNWERESPIQPDPNIEYLHHQIAFVRRFYYKKSQHTLQHHSVGAST